MDIANILVTAGISGGVGIASAALMLWKNAAVSDKEYNLRIASIKEELKKGNDLLDKRDEEFTSDVKNILNELRAVVLTVAKLQASQDVINSVTASTLASLAKKNDEHEKALNELQGSVSFIRQLFERMEKKGQ